MSPVVPASSPLAAAAGTETAPDQPRPPASAAADPATAPTALVPPARSDAAPAPAGDLATLFARLQRTPPVSDAFHELRWRRALRQPLQVAGVLSWHGGMAFQRQVQQPYRETSRLENGDLIQQREGSAERSVPLRRAPELRVLFEGLAALFAGDAAAFSALFEVTLVQAGAQASGHTDASAAAGDPDQATGAWRLDLAPREAALRQRVPALSFHGRGDHARCLVLHQGSAQTLIVLDDAPLPAAPAVASDARRRSTRTSAAAAGDDNPQLQARIGQLCPLPGDAGNH